jgi:hypothetical protein
LRDPHWSSFPCCGCCWRVPLANSSA